MAALKAASADFRDKTIHTNDTAIAKQATADKNASRESIEVLIRTIVRQIKARSDYNEGQGAQLGIVGPERTQDFATAHPDLSGIDQTGGRVALSFTKYKVRASIFTANAKTMPIGYCWLMHNYSVPLFEKEGLGEILLDKSPSIPLFQRGR